MVVGLGAGGGEVVEEGVEELVRGRVLGAILAAERAGHLGNVAGECGRGRVDCKGAKAAEGRKVLGWSEEQRLGKCVEFPQLRSSMWPPASL